MNTPATDGNGQTDVQTHVRNRLDPNEKLILVTDTDIGRDGRFGARWLVVTSDRIMTFASDGPLAEPEEEVRLGDVKLVKPVHLVGQVALEAEADGRMIELLRCTNSLAEKFAKVAKSLTDACKDAKPLEFDLEEEERRTCPDCGRLLPEKGSFCPACLKKHRVAARFWKYLAPHWGKALAVSASIIIGTAAQLCPPYLVKILVDDVFGAKRGAGLLLLLVGALAGLQLFATLLAILRGRLSAWLGSKIMHDVRFDFYQSIQGLSLRRHDKTPTGSLMSRLTGDTMMLNDAFIFVGFWVLPSILQVLGIFVVLLIMNWKLGLLVLAPAPVVVVMTASFFRLIHGYYHRWWQRRAKMSALANDAISGIRIVKAFSREPEEVKRFGARSYAFFEAWATADGMWVTAMPLISFVAMMGTYFVWYFGGLNVLNRPDTMQLGTLMAFIMYLGMFYGPLQMLTRVSDFLNRAFTAAQRLFEIMDADQEVYDDPRAKPLENLRGEFEFKDVHFGYEPDKEVLKGIDFKIEAGEMVGLVGRSGVGKTTITNLICRFYDVNEGSIRLDGVNVRDIRLRDLRRRIGIVPQECYLFDGTIAENIAYAQPGVTREQIMRAAIAANAHGFILRFPDGYDTRVGERGARLSGGEKQRVAIARAILHDPKILILDEATSSVDTETEELLQEALKRLVEGRTTIAIAHRLSTLRNANRLFVIDEGKMAESGTHDELFEKKGIYHKLVEMQSKLSAIKAVDG
ncbi:MAG TPA: ABC transporter ATP-binding protein [Candidatus Hydrogenedentes bacterium]|nr:ABC transporter ATP-binding protein [Candidatus Hydrogenedentota bacterium]